MPQNAKYTCASTRATHLVLSAESFLQSFRRFARRRDLPSAVLSDNARTFKPSKKNGPTLNCYLGRSRQPSAGSFK